MLGTRTDQSAKKPLDVPAKAAILTDDLVTQMNLVKNVLLEYLDLYRQFRLADRSTFGALVKWGMEKGASFVTKKDPVVEQIDKIIEKVKSEINTVKEYYVDLWKLIFSLRDFATEAQGLKYKNDSSLLAETLHALASLIVYESKNNPVLATEYERETAKLRLEYEKNIATQKHSRDVRDGMGIVEANLDVANSLYKLSMLGDNAKYLNKAIERHRLDHLKIPEPVDIHNYKADPKIVYRGAPLCLQPNFCEWLYMAKYNTSISHVDFDKFLKDAQTKPERERKEKQIEEKIKRDRFEKIAMLRKQQADKEKEQAAKDQKEKDTASKPAPQLSSSKQGVDKEKEQAEKAKDEKEPAQKPAPKASENPQEDSGAQAEAKPEVKQHKGKTSRTGVFAKRTPPKKHASPNPEQQQEAQKDEVKGEPLSFKPN